MSFNKRDDRLSLAQMLHEIELGVARTYRFTGVDRLSHRVKMALQSVPRHVFVPPEEKNQAYFNMPLPIGQGQTISQPFIVAIMTEVLDVQRTDKVLEIGTGSGYQAAVLAQLTHHVFTVEIIASLSLEAKTRFNELGYNTIHTKVGDGSKGWSEHEPYQKIIVTAAADNVPSALIEQLAPQGKMIIPLGKVGDIQVLTLIEKDKNGKIFSRALFDVRFVPLTAYSNQ